MEKISVCHITPHLGGGVGSVVKSWIRNAPTCQQHTILCLDKNINSDWQQLDADYLNVHIEDGVWHRDTFATLFGQQVSKADIVVVHWWNHPLLYDVLLNYTWPPCRLAVWNHVSGLHAPYVVSEEVVNFSDKFVCTSSITIENVDIKPFANRNPDKCHVIWSTVGNDAFRVFPRTEHDSFFVGYTGTVDIGKLHRNYIQMSAAARLPDMQFIVCSGDSQEHLRAKAHSENVEDQFSFMGRVPSVLPYLAQYDVFGYPLQREHFGTCEQSLGEAMMAGCVPVVLNNPAEQYIVEDGKCGLVVATEQEYTEALKRLYFDRTLLRTLSRRARDRALQLYDLQPTLEAWNHLFEEMMTRSKRTRSYYNTTQSSYTPAELYIAALGCHAVPLRDSLVTRTSRERTSIQNAIAELFASNSMFQSSNKGSVFQYIHFFPYDTVLQNWGKIAMNEKERSCQH